MKVTLTVFQECELAVAIAREFKAHGVDSLDVLDAYGALKSFDNVIRYYKECVSQGIPLVDRSGRDTESKKRATGNNRFGWVSPNYLKFKELIAESPEMKAKDLAPLIGVHVNQISIYKKKFKKELQEAA